tara:strand:- start:1332 stop:2957 length:1626 start_codon:yes stop_codon:yes gene_type:complete
MKKVYLTLVLLLATITTKAQVFIDTLELSIYENGLYDSILLPNLQQYNPVFVSNGLKIDIPPRTTADFDFPLQFHLDTNLLINYDSVKISTPNVASFGAIGKAHINSFSYTVPAFLLPDSMLAISYYLNDTAYVFPYGVYSSLITICQNCSSIQSDSNFLFNVNMDYWNVPYTGYKEKCYNYFGPSCTFSIPFNFNTDLDSIYHFDITPFSTAQMIQKDFCTNISNQISDPFDSSFVYSDCLFNTVPAILNNMYISIILEQKFYLYAYRKCTPSTSSLNISACNSYISPSGKVWTTSNTYLDTIPNAINCDSIITINLTVNNSELLSNQNNSICQRDSLLIYGVYQNTGGVYYDSLQTSNGCDSVLSTTLTINTIPNVSINSFNPDTVCYNTNAVTLPTGSPSGGHYTGNGVIGGSFDPSSAGTGTHDIIYTYTDGNSCKNSDTTIVKVEICTGIENITTDFGIIIYPNPSTGKFTIEKPSDLNKEVQVNLLDATSKLILEKLIPIGTQKVEIDLRNYSKGIYYLNIVVDDGIFIKNILKN